MDREEIWAPAHVVDTPRHLDELTADIRQRGIRVPLLLEFNRSFGFLDGNHRIAVALRLGLPAVPVELVAVPEDHRRPHGRPMRAEDHAILTASAGS